MAEEAANAFFEGMNCLRAIQQALHPNTWGPDPAWPEVLTRMEKPLELIRAGTFQTDMVITDEDLEQLRRLRELLAAGPTEELRSLVGTLLRRYRLDRAAV